MGRLSLDLGVQGRRVFGGFDHLRILAKTKPGVPWNLSISSCQTRSMVMSVVRRAVRMSPPARRLPCTEIGIPTSLTRTPSSPLSSLRKQAWPVACRKAASSSCRFSQS